MLSERLESMEKKDLVSLIVEYDRYVKGFDKDLQNCDRAPVSLSEFLDNDYPVILVEKADAEKKRKIQTAMIKKMFGGNM